MEIFGIGPLELLLIFILALVFIGPGKMPEVAASLGKMLREFRAASAELTDALNAEIAEAERRKTAVAADGNGNGHSEADAAQAEIVAQGVLDAPPAVEFTSPEVINYNYAPPVEPAPAPAATIDDVLDAIARQEAEEAKRREAEQAARLAAIALERDIRNGVGPLPETLLLPSTDAPLVVVNPTEQSAPEPVMPEAASDEAPSEAAEAVIAEPESASDEARADASPPTPNGQPRDVEQASEAPDEKVAEAQSESLETSGAGQAEVL